MLGMPDWPDLAEDGGRVTPSALIWDASGQDGHSTQSELQCVRWARGKGRPSGVASRVWVQATASEALGASSSFSSRSLSLAPRSTQQRAAPHQHPEPPLQAQRHGRPHRPHQAHGGPASLG